MTDRIHDMSEERAMREEKEEAVKCVREAFVLPKNIRQMGQPGQRHKFYIEDYVYTYLHTFLKEKHQEDTLQTAVLLGYQEERDACSYTFISGAAACDFSVFYEDGDRQIQESIDRHFPGRKIAGWYVRCTGQDAHVQSVIKHYYAERGGEGALSFIYEDDLEDAFDVYVWEQNALRPLEGFYIYYEKNPQMQEFLIWEKGGQASEPPILVPDRAREAEREPAAELVERRKLPNRERKSHRVLYAACAVALLAAVATGVTQMGNYQNLKRFPKTIQAMSDGILHRQEPASEESGESVQPVDLEKEKNKDDDVLAIPKKNRASEEEKGAAAEQNTSQAEGEERAAAEQNASQAEGEESTAAEHNVSEAEEEENTAGKKEDLPAQDEKQQSAGALKKNYYTVKKGDSLLSISRDLYKTDVMVDAICAENGISNVDVIYEGQKLRLP